MSTDTEESRQIMKTQFMSVRRKFIQLTTGQQVIHPAVVKEDSTMTFKVPDFWETGSESMNGSTKHPIRLKKTFRNVSQHFHVSSIIL